MAQTIEQARARRNAVVREGGERLPSDPWCLSGDCVRVLQGRFSSIATDHVEIKLNVHDTFIIGKTVVEGTRESGVSKQETPHHSLD